MKIVIVVLCVCIAFWILLITVIIPKLKLNKAMTLLDEGDYEYAYAQLEEMGKDDVIETNKYDRAMKYIDSEDYDSAYALLKEIGKDDVIKTNKYDRAMKYIDSEDYGPAYALLKEIGKYKVIDANKYDRAMKCIDAGDYETAYELLKDISYKDSYNKFLSVKMLLIAQANIGDTFSFGSYEQDDNTRNGKEDIEWFVGAKEGDRVLLISRKALEYKPYNNSSLDSTWEKCTLRKWMNETFLNDAFNKDEQTFIQDTYLAEDKNSEYNTNSGNATTDKVFLLSINEVNTYLYDDKTLTCFPTGYARKDDYVNEKNGYSTCCIWLRTSGGKQNRAAVLLSTGEIDSYGELNYSDGYVRPAIWISIEP